MQKAWKEELISSRDEAECFVERHFASLAIPVETILQAEPWDGDSTSAYIRLSVSDKKPIQPEQPTIMSASASVEDGVLHIENFRVANRFRKKDLSLINLKALIGTACEYAKPLRGIWAHAVSENGHRFWPSIGGLVEKPDIKSLLMKGAAEAQTSRGAHLKAFAQQYKYASAAAAWDRAQTSMEEIEQTDRKKLDVIERLGEQYPFSAYRELARTPFCHSDAGHLETACAGFLEVENALAGWEMYINLQEQSALALMRSKLGTLPCCPIPLETRQSRYHPIALERACREGDQVFLKQYKQFEQHSLRL